MDNLVEVYMLTIARLLTLAHLIVLMNNLRKYNLDEIVMMKADG